MYKCKYFKLEELVSPRVYDKYGEMAWQFLDERLLKTIDDLREFFNKPITVNDWLWGGKFTQRCYRSNLDELVKSKTLKDKLYCSQHSMGRAIDFHIKGISAQSIRNKIILNKEKFKYITFMEDKVNWVHIDIRNSPYKGIYLF